MSGKSKFGKLGRSIGVRKKDRRLTWDETYRETAREKEDWSDLDATMADGIWPGENLGSDAALMLPRR